MIRRNSCWFTSPSPSLSASSIISFTSTWVGIKWGQCRDGEVWTTHVIYCWLTCSSSSVRFSPSSLATLFRFLKEILPVSSSSNRRKAFRISSLESFSALKKGRDRRVAVLSWGGQTNRCFKRKGRGDEKRNKKSADVAGVHTLVWLKIRFPFSV